jgi:hypothetical protein
MELLSAQLRKGEVGSESTLGESGCSARPLVIMGDEVKSGDDCDCRDADQNSSPEWTQRLLSLGDWITFAHPICAEILRDVEHLHVGEAHRVQSVVSGFDVWTMAPGTTAAINEDECFSRKRLNARAQLLKAGLTGSGADVLGAGNMCLFEENVGADLDHERLFSFRCLKELDQVFRVDQL